MPPQHWPADDELTDFDGQSTELGLVAEQTRPHWRSSTIDGSVTDTAVKWLIGVLLPLNWRTNIDLIITVSR